jgi:GTPase SAR1 family protein
MAVFYSFEADDATTIQAAEYNNSSEDWMETGETETQTTQFLKEEGSWNMVSAVLYTMVADDYQIIVDYVKNNIGEDEVDSYGTGEYYYGTSAYYSEFRTKDSYRDTEEFATWQEAVEEAIGTVFLPNKYPDAEEGVTYIITFAGYYNAMVDYSIQFECTAAGTTPEFTMTVAPAEK